MQYEFPSKYCLDLKLQYLKSAMESHGVAGKDAVLVEATRPSGKQSRRQH